MAVFRRSIRSCHVLAAFAMLVALATGPAKARLADVGSVLTIRYVTAIHEPTGCMAKMEFSGETLLGAYIDDPLCLPVDVKFRTVPAFKQDFHVPASRHKTLTIR